MSMRSLSSDDIHYSPKGLFGQSKNLYRYQKWGLGRSPKRGEGGSPTLSPGMDAGRVCPKALQGRKANKAYTAFHREMGFRQGCQNKDTPSFEHGCLQVVEQSRCRTHRQQTTTVAQKQSHQSVLKGIGIADKHLFEKTLFLQAVIRRHGINR